MTFTFSIHETYFFSFKNSLESRMQSSLGPSWGLSYGGKRTGYNEGQLANMLKMSSKLKVQFALCNIISFC